MKILYVVHGFPPRNTAGTETYTFSLAQQIRKEHETRIFYRFADPAKKEYMVEKGTYEGLDYWTLNNTYKERNGFEAYYINPDLETPFRVCLEDFNPDLVHFTYVLGGLSAQYLDIVRKYSIPMVLTLTDFVFLCCRGQLLNRDFQLCSGPDEGLNCLPCLWGGPIDHYKKPLPRLLKKILPAAWIPQKIQQANFTKINRRLNFLREAINKVDVVIAPTQLLGKTYEAWGVQKEKIIYSGYGIKTDLFKNYQRTHSPVVRFGFFGQLLPHKGLHVLIDTAKRLGNYQFKIIIHGDSSFPEAKAYLNDLLSQAPRDKVEYRGNYPLEETSRAYEAIDVLIVPSLWYENSPLVMLYALHTRTPLIVSHLEGMSSFVEHQKTGLVFPAGDAEKLASCLKFFLDHPEEIPRMGKIMKPVKTAEQNARELTEIYTKLVMRNAS